VSKKPKQVHFCQSCEVAMKTKRIYCGDRCKQIQLCKSMGTTKYKTNHVAPTFQRMLRAEWGASLDKVSMAVVKGSMTRIIRRAGQCVCITCGQVCPWECGAFERQLHAGHFLAGRGSILFEEEGVQPQCALCNRHHGGRPLEFRIWMEHTYGIETIERLDAMKRQPLSRSRDELVDMRLDFDRRLKAALLQMKVMT
jgi:hypothetical protein